MFHWFGVVTFFPQFSLYLSCSISRGNKMNIRLTEMISYIVDWTQFSCNQTVHQGDALPPVQNNGEWKRISELICSLGRTLCTPYNEQFPKNTSVKNMNKMRFIFASGSPNPEKSNPHRCTRRAISQ